MSHLTIVLLCSGSNNDATTIYRPSRDDVRYRYRHDALVRCVASSLFGPAGASVLCSSPDGATGAAYGGNVAGRLIGNSRGVGSSCELIFLYDDDFSCMHMSISSDTSMTSSVTSQMSSSMAVPSEQHIVSQWRDAAKEASKQRQSNDSREINNRGTLGNIHGIIKKSNFEGSHGNLNETWGISREISRDIGNGSKHESKSFLLKTMCVLDGWKSVSCSSSSSATLPAFSPTSLPSSFPSTSSTTRPNSSHKFHSKKVKENDTSFEKSSNLSKLRPMSKISKIQKSPILSKLSKNMPLSKRDIITQLQTICHVDYLRYHHLNVPLQVALRKVNKKCLINAWNGWNDWLDNMNHNIVATSIDGKDDGNQQDYVNDKNNTHGKRNDFSSNNNENGGNADSSVKDDRMERTFRYILQKAQQKIQIRDDQLKCSSDSSKSSSPLTKNNNIPNIMAVYLHESCHAELPCWRMNLEDDETSTTHDTFANDTTTRTTEDIPHVVLFLGAVRDMNAHEYGSLFRACTAANNIPCLPCRIGHVPEFTSKIVSVVGYHHYRGFLSRALLRLYRLQHGTVHQERKERDREISTPLTPIILSSAISSSTISSSTLKSSTSNSSTSSIPSIPSRRTLHTMALIPIPSHALSHDISKRDRVHWCIVRLCVCALWRSKLASSSSSDTSARADACANDSVGISTPSSNLIHNILTLVFQDGIVITLHQNEFISKLASNHRAAPTERQILQELCIQRDATMEQYMTENDTTMLHDLGNKFQTIIADSILKRSGCQQPIFMDNNDVTDVFALDYTAMTEQSKQHQQMKQLVEIAYSERKTSTTNPNHSSFTANIGDCILFVILSVRSDVNSVISTNNITTKSDIANNYHSPQQIHTLLKSTFLSNGITVLSQTPLLSHLPCIQPNHIHRVQDEEACTVIMLQHFDYQNKLFPALNYINNHLTRQCGNTDECIDNKNDNYKRTNRDVAYKCDNLELETNERRQTMKKKKKHKSEEKKVNLKKRKRANDTSTSKFNSHHDKKIEQSLQSKIKENDDKMRSKGGIEYNNEKKYDDLRGVLKKKKKLKKKKCK